MTTIGMLFFIPGTSSRTLERSSARLLRGSQATPVLGAVRFPHGGRWEVHPLRLPTDPAPEGDPVLRGREGLQLGRIRA